MAVYDIAFVLEQALGHITHAKNLQANVPKDPEVRAHWALVDFATEGIASQIPIYNSNWTVRAGMRARQQLAQLARQNKLHAAFFHTQVPAILARSWLERIPSIVSLDASPLQYDQFGQAYQHDKGAAWLESLKWRLNRDCYKTARRLVAWSDWTKQGLVKDYEVPPEKVVVIPPGVNVADWRSPSLPKASSGPVKILFVGANFERKGGLNLLEAFRALRPLGIELHLVTKDRIAAEPGLFIYNDMEPNSQALKQLYHGCDIFALPTFGDILPMVLSEAGAAGLAIVSTNIAGIPEIVRPEDTGLLVSPGDTDALKQALQRLIERPDERLSFASRALAHVARRYDAETNARQLLDMLKAEAERARPQAA